MTDAKQKISVATCLLTAAMAAGAAMVLLQLIYSVDMYRDTANVYACMSRSLANGEYSEAFHPGIPLLNVLLSRPFTVIGLRPEKALALVSELFYLGTIPLLYLFLREFLQKAPAAFGALLYACAPKIIRFSCTPLIDSGKIFFLVAGMFFACRFIRGGFRSRRFALAMGVAMGGITLARSEGVGNAGLLYVGVALIWLWRCFREKRLLPVVPMLIALLPLAVAILFRMWCNWRFCGYFVFDLRIHNMLCYMLGRSPIVFTALSGPTAPAVAKPPAMLLWQNSFESFISGSYEVYFGLAILGVVLLISARLGGKWHRLWPDRRVPEYLKWDSFYLVILLNVLGNLLIFRISKLTAYRYFLVNIPLQMVLVVITVCWLWSWVVKLLPKRALAIPLLGVAALLAIQVVNGAGNFFSEKSRRQYRNGLEAGRIMRKENPAARVWFKQASVEWYYSGMKRAVPIETPQPDPGTFADFDYLIADRKLDEMEKKTLAVITARPDIEEIPMPEDSTVRLFRKMVVK